MAMAFFGVFEMLLIVLLSGAFGAPVSLPPAPHDPWFDQIAPEDPLYYTVWSGSAIADRASTNATERMLAGPEAVAFGREIDRILDVGSDRFLPALSEDDRAIRYLIARLIRTMIDHPVCAYVADLKFGADGFEIDAALVIKVSDRRAELQPLIESLGSDAEGNFETVEIDGETFRAGRSAPGTPLVWFGFRGDYLILALGDDPVRSLVARTDHPTPQWLSETRELLAIDRIATVSYVDVERLLAVSGDLAGEMPGELGMLSAMGIQTLSGVDRYRAVTGLDATGFAVRTHVGIAADSPLSRALSDAPLLPEDFATIPDDAPVAIVTKFDGLEALGLLGGGAAMMFGAPIEPGAALDEVSRAIDAQIGFGLDEILNEVFADTLAIYAAPTEGGVISGWVGIVKVRDPQAARLVFDRVVGLAEQGLPDVRLRTEEHAGTTFVIADPADDAPFSMAFALTDRELVVSPFRNAAIGHVRRIGTFRDLGQDAHIAGRFAADDMQGTGMRVVLRMDHAELIRIFQPMLLMMVRSSVDELNRSTGLDLDPLSIPSVGALTRDLEPVTATLMRVDGGYFWETHQTFPGTDLPAIAPLAVMAGLPAIFTARSAARRMQSQNNMRQIELAIHNYESAYGSLPARANVDPQGKPLLSWRVHILPFLDQQALYEEFHLDEPWDSDHNRQLIERMPTVYARPGNDATDGRTPYLGNATENGMFVAGEPQQNPAAAPRGIGFRDVLDGTSNTVMLVEANDESRVVWTQPDDFDDLEMDPLARLLGARDDGILFGFGDGSVRLAPLPIEFGLLRRLFDRQDGEVIQIDW